jgi:FAD dependent oxidoreductase TIGR03364
MKSTQVDVVVVGGGIVGLAHALACARRGESVVVFERSSRAVGASVRNFGLLWPVGQPEGERHARAMRARAIWGEVAAATGLYLADTGSLHLAYHEDEMVVLREFSHGAVGSILGRHLVGPREVAQLSPAVNHAGLLGALWSPTEATVDPRQALRLIPKWLERRHGVSFHFDTTVRSIDLPSVETTAGTWNAKRIYVCSGQDFETLYPEVYASSGITRCKLQMMRTQPQPAGWKLGPALCAGLTLAHYDSFKGCQSLGALKERFGRDYPFHVSNGIHVLLSQTAEGELTIGDSHHYGATVDPFDREDINAAFIGTLRKFASLPTLDIAERWHGIYPKMMAGQSELIANPSPGVWVVNGLGGAGMTLSFGLAEEVVSRS